MYLMNTFPLPFKILLWLIAIVMVSAMILSMREREARKAVLYGKIGGCCLLVFLLLILATAVFCAIYGLPFLS